MGTTIHVLLVEDETIVSEAIRALLELEEGIAVIAEASTAAEAIRKASTLQPDVILLDLRLPDQPGIEVIETLVEQESEARIVVLTAYADDEEVTNVFRAGAVGYVLKTQAVTELVRAIEDAYQGQTLLHPTIARKILQGLNHSADVPAIETPLSEAELRVLLGVAQGQTNRTIGLTLGVSHTTVRTHISRIMHKLRLKNRTQMALYALKEGLIDLETAVNANQDLANPSSGVTPKKGPHPSATTIPSPFPRQS
jgi:two-component system, NarL family, response regulator LiaR